ncbi:MAG: HRDC domain-containing protein [Chloroflexi bacterium]|nr:HRDC domain-containing protein [Chloroflexota bacterium]MCY4248484.1 HRDC domain-containing protein [Chloroflexota bacterium]
MLDPATTIEDRRSLDAAVERMAAQPRLAIDTESNSMYAYRGRTCLIQVSTAAEDLLIDPLAIDDIGALGGILADAGIEKVFHAAEYDLICLKRDFDFDVCGIFDTMAAARVCGYARIGLGNMLSDLLGVPHSKKHQTDDWARRPLPASYRRYAQMDTHYLLRLRDCLHAQLAAANKLDEAYEYFDDVTRFELKSLDFDPDGFWTLSRPGALDKRQMAALRELYILRDELAQARDEPPGRMLSNKALLQIAKSLPRRQSELEGLRGLPRWLVRRHGHEIIEAVKHGAESRLPLAPPRQPRIPNHIAERYNALINWRRQTARARGVESDVIMSKDTLWQIAHRQPGTSDDLRGIDGLGPWRRGEYGAQLLGVVNGRG